MAVQRIAATAALSLTFAAGAAHAEQFIGPANSFTIEFDDQWQVIQAQNKAGLTCKADACGGDRVFCVMLPRTDAAAAPGKPLPDALIKKFGDGVVASPGPGVTMEYAAPFAPRTLGSVNGSWAEIKATTDKGVNHFGLFLFAAPGFDIAFECGAPDAKWDAHREKIEKVLAAVKLNDAPVAPAAAPAESPSGPQEQPK